MYSLEIPFFEVLTDGLGCLRWICRHVVQAFVAHETTKLRQRIRYDTEIFVLRIDVSLRVKTKVSRTHIYVSSNGTFFWRIDAQLASNLCRISVKVVSKQYRISVEFAQWRPTDSPPFSRTDMQDKYCVNCYNIYSIQTLYKGNHKERSHEMTSNHICSHIRYAQLLYIWTCIASGSGCEIIVQLVIATILCFLVRCLECGVCRNWSFLHGVRAQWFRRLAL